ncbi:LysM peptidoglycan-binding domain-containing protein [Candidatus Saccharibacteria bacterium]|nr:MAG: LysM peptidoglycan-binding domain-containing protein [Candidatus Saccharibacteria bacterium]
MSEIAQRRGLDYREIAKANNIDNPDIIRSGQVIKLPSSPVGGGMAGVGDDNALATTPISLTSFTKNP